MSAFHWADDPTNDVDWNNYSRGWDAGRAGRDLHPDAGQPFADGWADGRAERANH